jgi:hypothetical protein
MSEHAPYAPYSGCGAPVPQSEGPTHKYVVASPGCWAVYGTLLAREYGAFHYPAVHRLTVDAYMAQHPGNAEHDRRQRQSVAVHLCALCLAIEGGLPLPQVTEELGRLTRQRSDWPLLSAPLAPHWLTVVDVIGAADLAEHTARVERWAHSVWEAWAPHHATIRQWATGVPC